MLEHAPREGAARIAHAAAIPDAASVRITDTAGMIYSVYGRWNHGAEIRSTVVEQISAAFRPDDESVCVWLEPNDPYVLRISADVEATTYEDALILGRSALDEAAKLVPLAGRPVEVVAMTEEGQSTWSA